MGGIQGGTSSNKGNSGPSVTYTEPVIPIPVPDDKSEVVFSDVPAEAWYYDAVMELASKGVVNGTGDGIFEPQRTISREEFAAILCRAFDIAGKDASQVYSDIPETAWYNRYVGGAQACGIINGISKTEFGTGLDITRQDMCVMIDRVLKYKGINTDVQYDNRFSDHTDISEYAVDSVYALKRLSVISGRGDNAFAAHEGSTRAEVAQIIVNAINALLINN
ncbi:MAG: S-layer homology domain-containing protein [Clostridia bacterium]|nr:S-layer homology domain-containing protein [Clostridia bacterium]